MTAKQFEGHLPVHMSVHLCAERAQPQTGVLYLCSEIYDFSQSVDIAKKKSLKRNAILNYIVHTTLKCYQQLGSHCSHKHTAA